MRTIIPILTLAALSAQTIAAQTPAAEVQIQQAVTALPEPMRAGASVLGYDGGALTWLRRGTNSMICLADDPAREGFSAACYHKDLEPFMARGRELRAAGVTRLDEVNAARLADIEAGRLKMPERPASLFVTSGDTAESARPRQVIYVPYATEETTGIPAQPSRTRPWLMAPGTPWAHVMISLPPRD